MKFTIDTENKTITIEGKVTLLELLELVMILNSDAEDYEVNIIKAKEEKDVYNDLIEMLFDPKNFNTTNTK